jgi:hypothetical protein
MKFLKTLKHQLKNKKTFFNYINESDNDFQYYLARPIIAIEMANDTITSFDNREESLL